MIIFSVSKRIQCYADVRLTQSCLLYLPRHFTLVLDRFFYISPRSAYY